MSVEVRNAGLVSTERTPAKMLVPMYQGFEYVTMFVLAPAHGQPYGAQSIFFSAPQAVPSKMLTRLKQSLR